MSRLVTPQELARQRQLRQERIKVADRHNIAVGWVAADLTVMKQANGQPPPQLPKRPKDVP